MPEVARETDPISTGHKTCDATSTIEKHATNCYAEGLRIARMGDKITDHNAPSGKDCASHTVYIAGGSSTVFVEGKAIARKGDAVDEGEITGHANTVFAG